MVTTRSGHRTRNQQELSVLLSNILNLTSSQGQPKEIIAEPVEGIQEPYLTTIDL